MGGSEELEGRTGGRDGLAFWAILLFAFSMYASVANLVPALEVVRPALLTSTVAAGAVFMRRIFRGERLSLDGWRGPLLLGVCLLALASVSWSAYPEATKVFVGELFKEWAVYVTVAVVACNARRLRALLVACALGGLAPAWGSLQNYLDGTNLVDGTRARWLGVYTDPNHMAMAMVFLVPVGLALVLRGRGWQKLLGVLSLAGSLTAIAVSGSRGGFMGLCAAVLLWILRERNRLRSLAVFAVAAALFVALSPAMFWNRTNTIADYRQDAAAMGRIHAWEVTRAINLDRPLLGVGAGAFVYAWPKYAPLEARGEAYVAHNVFLAMLGELGWVGFWMYLVFVAGALAVAYRAGDAPAGGPWVRAVFAGAVGYLICDTSAGYVNSAHFFFIFGLLAATERLREHEQAVLGGAPVVEAPPAWAPPERLGPAL